MSLVAHDTGQMVVCRDWSVFVFLTRKYCDQDFHSTLVGKVFGYR